jgi:hypothetical protein
MLIALDQSLPKPIKSFGKLEKKIKHKFTLDFGN